MAQSETYTQQSTLPHLRARAGVILIENDCVALIHRQRAERDYYVFPGGSVEAGETPEQAAVREVAEELGLQVALGALIANIWHRGREQFYFRAQRLSGTFGTGTGPEMRGEYPPERGTYAPVWLPIADLPQYPIHSQPLAKLIRRAHPNRWPDRPVSIIEA